MEIYGVQMMLNHIDDTVTLFTSEKKAIKFLNEARKINKNRDFVLKKFKIYKGKGIEIIIKLPF